MREQGGVTHKKVDSGEVFRFEGGRGETYLEVDGLQLAFVNTVAMFESSCAGFPVAAFTIGSRVLRQLPRRQLRLVQCQLHDLATHIVRDTVPDVLRPKRAVFPAFRPVTQDLS